MDLDGIRAEEIKKSLAADVQTEITHAQGLAERIKEIGGRVPGSFVFKPEQASLQPPEDSTDVVAVIHGVIEAENAATPRFNNTTRLSAYTKLTQFVARGPCASQCQKTSNQVNLVLCDGIDYVTQDLCVKLLADEEKHRREFRGFLKEYEND